MGTIRDKFISDSERKAFDREHRSIIKYNMSKYDMAVERGKQQFANLELAKRQASLKKYRPVENLENSLKEFDQNFSRRGGKVLWARDAAEANGYILDILKKAEARLVVKSKSMVTEELQLDKFLQPHDIETAETDLGEYIVQISDDKPYHIVTPVMHRSAKQIATIFNAKFDLDPESSPRQITKFVRKTLREKFLHADAGITGANFLISSTGSVAVTENEGNGVLAMSMPRIHIVVAGIEKVIESMDDLHLFWPLLATFGTGQNITAYNSIINGPAQKGEVDGPREMYVILLDNGRTNLLAKIPQRRALTCIRCGACLNGCPVYHNIGGHTYASVYPGPIGAVITPHLKSMEEYSHLSYATSLCGKCTEVCPVKIPLHHLLLENRNLAVKLKLPSRPEKWGMLAWEKAMLSRKLMDFAGAKIKNFMLGKLFKGSWGKRRDLPEVKPKSFARLWYERNGKK